MFTFKRLIGHSLVVFFLAGTALAQNLAQKNPTPIENPTGSAPLLTASASRERVRFVSPGTVVRLRLEVYHETGQKLFDSELHRGNVLDWHLQDGAGQRLAAGSYACVVTIKSLSGRLSQRVGLVTVTDTKVAVDAGGWDKFSHAQQQAVGAIEENAALAVLPDGDVPSATIISHDEQDGQLTSTKGALTFRTGNVFAGEDKEHMRITEDGRVGIGTNKPESALDVAGTVRVSKGVQFSDGSTLDAIGGKLKTRDGTGTLVPSVAGTGTIDRIVKWAETGGEGTLANAAAAETDGLTIFGENASGEVAPLFPTAPSTHVVEVGATGSKSPLILAGGAGVMEVWKDLGGGTGDPAAAVSFGMAKPGTASTNDMIFSTQLAGQSWTEQMRVTSEGNLGIGTTNPIFNDDGVTGANVGKWVAIDGGASGNSGYLGLGGTVPGVTDRVGVLNFYNWSMGGVDHRTATIASYNDDELGKGNLQFSTTPNNVGPVERMRIGWHGGIGINTTGAANTAISLKGFTADSTSYGLTLKQATGDPYFFARNDRKVFVATTDPNSILPSTMNASFFVGQTGQFSVNSTGDAVQNSLTLKGATSGSVALMASATGGGLIVGSATLTDGAGQILSSALNTVAVEKGGTGQTTASAAFNVLAPSQASNSGKFLTTDGTDTSWASVIGATGDVTTNRIVKFTDEEGTLGDSAITEVDGKVFVATADPNSITPPTPGSTFFVGQTGQFSVNSTGDAVQNSITLKGAASGSVALAASATGGGLTVGSTTLTDGAGRVLSSALNTVAVEQGGTGQTTTMTAFNALAPAQTSSSGKFLTTDGTNTSWANVVFTPPNGTNDRIVKFTDGAGTLGDSAITEVNGKVGINTTTPGASLHIGGTANQDLFAGMGPDITVGPAFNFGYGGLSFGRGVGFFNVRPDAAAVAPNPSLRFMTANVERMIVTNAGNVGIGVTNPIAKLDVGGTVKLAAPAAGTGVALCRNSTTGLIVNCSASSLRYKGNIFGLRAGLDVVRRLRPVSFVWKENGQRDLGLVAEEVNQVEPLLALHNAAGEIEGVRYNRLSVVLVNAVQEQQQQLQAKEARIAALEARLAELERAVNRRRRGQSTVRR